MIYIITWIFFALLVGAIGRSREIGFGAALAWSILLSPIVGLIITLISDPIKNGNKKPSYKQYIELGKKAEYKGQQEKAIDYFMDALYHLENDYKDRKLSKSQNVKRIQHIENLKKKVEELKSNQT